MDVAISKNSGKSKSGKSNSDNTCANCLDLSLVSVLSKHSRSSLERGQTAHTARPHGPCPNLVDGLFFRRNPATLTHWVWIEDTYCSFCKFLRGFIMRAQCSSLELLQSELQLEKRDMTLDVDEQLDRRDSWHYVRIRLVPRNDRANPLNGSVIGWFGAAGGPDSRSRGQRGCLQSVRQVPNQIDLGDVRRRLDLCAQTHNICRGKTGTYPPHLRLIDCATRSIIRAEVGTTYAALSYQWGSSTHRNQDNSGDQLPSRVPSTIEDAIVATTALGLQYLWVDAYCILQSGNQSHFQEQIGQMHLVYSCAYIALVAASGTGADCGLPGISVAASRRQITGSYQETQLLSFEDDPWETVRQSAWCSRGWTFQESFFANRRLFFTDKHYVLDCFESTRIESEVHERSPSMYNFRRQLPRFDPNMSHNTMLTLIEHYSARDLKFGHDNLNAFRGIMTAIETHKADIRFFSGMPLVRIFSGFHKSLVVNLLWKPHEPFLINPSTNQKEQARRKEFPSWSWTGWYCKAWLQSIPILEVTRVLGNIHEVLVSHVLPQWLSWHDFEEKFLSRSGVSCEGQRLVLSAPSMVVAIRPLRSYRGSWFDVSWGTTSSDESWIDMHHSFESLTSLHEDDPSDVKHFNAIHVASGTERYYFLLLTPVDDCWERIGLWTPTFVKRGEQGEFDEALRSNLDYRAREFRLA